jgi:hypothetical protein
MTAMTYRRVASATRRTGIALLVLLLLGLGGGLALAYGQGDQAATPVYMVSQIRAALSRQVTHRIWRGT